MEYSIGQVVYSKNGRDKGKAFVVTKIDEEYLFLADGVLRPLEKPKKKKNKHVQTSKTILFEIQKKLLSNEYLQNKDLEKALNQLLKDAEL